MKTIFFFIILIASSFTFSQKNGVIFMPESQVVFPYFQQIVEIKMNPKSKNKIHLECDGCDELLKVESQNDTWVFKTNTVKQLTIKAINQKGKIVDELKVKVSELPLPIVSLDGVNSQEIIKKIPSSISLKLHESVPITMGFVVRYWEITMNKKIFRGNGSLLSKELQDVIRNSKPGFIILDINYLSAVGSKNIKEVFEFNLE
jgi:hypothetical protein